MSIIVVGEPNTKRTEFFLQAAKQENTSVSNRTWEQVDAEGLEGAVVKLDPPSYAFSELNKGEKASKQYQKQLQKLQNSSVLWLNQPEEISQVLDKYACKKRLMKAGVAVSPMLQEQVSSMEQLQELMKRHNAFQVFIKPRYGSGAAGVMAYRCTKDWKKQQLFTSCILEKEILVNTKRLRKFEEKEEIRTLIENLLLGEVVVEQWIPKETYKNKSYDLRVVWQFGHCSFYIIRTSRGPITNLHLNNGAKEVDPTVLSQEELFKIEKLCEETMKVFPGLSVAGIDIALEKNSRRPFVIEVNGQGDLLYQDIYHDNCIYREQVREMEKWHSQLI